jgi:hypothetical protein
MLILEEERTFESLFLGKLDLTNHSLMEEDESFETPPLIDS